MDDLRILHLEDDEADAELVARSLRKGGVPARLSRVDNLQDFVRAVGADTFDLVLSDFSLPDFDGLSALAAFRAKDLETPFIFVSGTIGEERAVDALRHGATDYILKDRLSRLPAAVQRAMEEREERQARQAAEQQIREQAALLDNAREAIVVEGLDRRVQFWNHGAERLYGWSAAEARAGRADARFGLGDRPDIDVAWASCLKHGSWDGCLRQLTRTGQEIVTEAHWTCLRDAQGLPRGVMSVGADITHTRNLELQLMRAQRLETMGMIASGVAHDLNNVLSPILLGIASLRRKVTDEAGQRLLNNMETSVQRGSDIVRQVVTFSRGGAEPSPAIDVREMVRDIERLVLATLPRNITPALSIPDDVWQVPGDATQIQQVLLNLCVNARDAMANGGRLTIRAENVTVAGARNGDYVKISVADTGHGMSPEVRARVFEPFFTTKQKGTGIGLSTAASIVKRHGGYVEVDSEADRGTEFRLFLPVAANPAAAPRASTTGRTLLVVEEGSVREIVRGTLEAYGYKVLGTDTVAQAVEHYERASAEIAAVLVNMAIPDLDGVALIRELIKRNGRVKVINTSDLTESLHTHGVESVVRATLPKPYTAERLLDVVSHVLEMA